MKFLYLAVFFFVASNLGHASSFDCAKATTQIENVICGNKELSMLDSSLGGLYRSLKQKNPNLVNEQKKWIRDSRDVCQTISCLKAVYSERIDALKNADICPVNENSLLGSWIRTQGSWAFEQMEFAVFEDKKEFTSWLHNHLEMVGTWEVEKCTIHVKHQTEDVMQFYLKIKKLDKDRLYLFDTDSRTELVYKYIR